MMKLFIFVLLALTASFPVQEAVFTPTTDYCKFSQEHIGCNPVNVSETDKCDTSDGGGFFYLTYEEQKLILHQHNIYRNALAGGQVNGFPAADHMPVITWDPELEYLAALNAQRCHYVHDKSRETDAFQFSGQNLGEIGYRTRYSENIDGINELVFLWFDEYRHTKRFAGFEDKQCFLSKNGKKVGHFITMSTDKTNKMGCAGIKYKKYDKDGYLMLIFNIACNYSYGHVNGEQAYIAVQPGKAAGVGCKTQTTRIYPYLCKTTEPVEAVPNPKVTTVYFQNAAGQQFKTEEAAVSYNIWPIKKIQARDNRENCPLLESKNE